MYGANRGNPQMPNGGPMQPQPMPPGLQSMNGGGLQGAAPMPFNMSGGMPPGGQMGGQFAGNPQLQSLFQVLQSRGMPPGAPPPMSGMTGGGLMAPPPDGGMNLSARAPDFRSGMSMTGGNTTSEPIDPALMAAMAAAKGPSMKPMAAPPLTAPPPGLRNAGSQVPGVSAGPGGVAGPSGASKPGAGAVLRPPVPQINPVSKQREFVPKKKVTYKKKA